MSQFQLMRRAVVLFPRSVYTRESSVRHARRKWIDAMVYMRCRDESLLAIDKFVGKVVKH